MFRCSFVGTVSAVSSCSAQCRQADPGRIEATIDGENLASDVARAVAAEKINGFSQFFLKAVPVERDRIVIIGADFGTVNLFRHRGVDRSWRYAIDANAELGEFDRQLLGQMRESCLAGAVG